MDVAEAGGSNEQSMEMHRTGGMKAAGTETSFVCMGACLHLSEALLSGSFQYIEAHT